VPEDTGLVAIAHTDGAHEHIIAGHKRAYLLLTLQKANHGDPQHTACQSKREQAGTTAIVPRYR